jgi:ABC-type multidrug transport system ATPase subunit
VLLLDEPSEGLAPLILQQIVTALKSLKEEGLAVLLVEQNLSMALALGDRHHVLNKGEICYTAASSGGGNRGNAGRTTEPACCFRATSLPAKMPLLKSSGQCRMIRERRLVMVFRGSAMKLERATALRADRRGRS